MCIVVLAGVQGLLPNGDEAPLSDLTGVALPSENQRWWRVHNGKQEAVLP